jgi:arginyl-tRNA synthetase
MQLKNQLKQALVNLLPAAASNLEVVIQDVPAGKPGDYGSPLAFVLAKTLKQNPVQVAADLAARVVLPAGIARAEAVGPFLNFFVDTAGFVAGMVNSRHEITPKNRKVIIEHTSVNPNKEWHVGHIRGALIGDAMARIYRSSGYTVEVQNYIDDTGRQAADSQFAIKHYGAVWDGKQKYDHWLGELYVRLHSDFPEKSEIKKTIEPEVTEVIHALERGDLREEIAKVLRSQLETAYSLGIEYDLLVWESDVVRAGFVEKALEIFGARLESPTEGKYAGSKGVDLSPFVPGLEEPFKVLVRGNGTFVYETKDIAYHYWKFGLFEGLEYQQFAVEPSGKELWTSSPNGEHEPAGQRFAHAQEVVNVIDARQSLAQMVVKAGLSLIADGNFVESHHHLANETVLLEGQTMSGRKGITVSADEVVAEAKSRALKLIKERRRVAPETYLENATTPEALAGATENLNLMNVRDRQISKQVGLGALKFAFLKAEPKRQIDFRWEQALALQGDTAVVVQYAHARARQMVNRLAATEWLTTDIEGANAEEKVENIKKLWPNRADWSMVGPLELELAKTVTKFSEVLEVCIRDTTPHPMCAYALELATGFNSYYNHKTQDGKSDTSALHSKPGLREARLELVVRVADAIREALGVLGIDAPEEM